MYCPSGEYTGFPSNPGFVVIFFGSPPATGTRNNSPFVLIASILSGTAVYTGGIWQVADSTFCGLVHLAYGKKPKLIPAACGS